MKSIDISVENANALRILILQSRKAYAAFDETQKKMQKRYSELAGPIEQDEIAALRKDTNRIDVVPHCEYFNDQTKEFWY
jgi:hypothetical protein